MTKGRRHVHASGDDFPAVGSRLLEVVDLKTHFHTPRGVVRAVDGVSFTLDRGRTLGLVGESGCGKSVLSRSIMGLLPSSARRQGEITFSGERIEGLGDAALREYWGTRMSMVFQDPMTSLNPVMRIGKQITESLEVHTDLDRGQARDTALALLRSHAVPRWVTITLLVHVASVLLSSLLPGGVARVSVMLLVVAFAGVAIQAVARDTATPRI